MNILSALLLAISANLDTFAVGISYGINCGSREIKVPFKSNLLIAFITSLGTWISMFFGSYLNNFITPQQADVLGAIMLIAMGSWFIIDFIIKERKKRTLERVNHRSMIEDPHKADVDNSGHIDSKESIALAIALAVNNVGVGIIASLAGISVIITTIFTFIVTVISMSLGCMLGRSPVAKVCGRYAPIVSGLLLIILGLIEIL